MRNVVSTLSCCEKAAGAHRANRGVVGAWPSEAGGLEARAGENYSLLAPGAGGSEFRRPGRVAFHDQPAQGNQADQLVSVQAASPEAAGGDLGRERVRHPQRRLR